MLYVFHVDTGRMIKFDMNVALGSVQNLKDIIQRGHGLPAENIVLLVSGGDMLASGKLVCSYSAGTDTNPIFMFSTIDVKSQQSPSIDSSNSDSDLSNQVKKCISLPASYSTVVIRAQLAQQMYELAREEETVCERLVHEQHLQQQGWSAVIANMEDLTDEFRQRFENFSNSFEEHLCNRNQYLELMKNFNDDLVNLSTIPILPGLLQHAHHEFHGFDDFLDNDDVFSRSQQNESMIMQLVADTTTNNDIIENSKGVTEIAIVSSSTGSGGVEQKRPRLSKENTPDSMSVGSAGCGVGGSGGSGKSSSVSSNKGGKSGRTLTLLQWITAKENHNALRTMAEECSQGLETFTAEKYEKLKNEVYNIINFAQQEDIKEIKGLESRLCGLEKMMFDLKKFVQDQKELSTAFQQNQNRASNLGDASIFPDLCASHQGQLSHMLNHHLKIRDYRRRVSKAKDELGANLNKRLKYIVHIENTMSNLDNNLLFYHRCLRRLQRHINIIQQIHQTPRIYVAAVTEVVRRRIFSSEFVQWASTLACDFDSIHSEEVKRRREFNTNFEGHFLNTLFPGMNDMPPAFANENPIVFDASLPNITKNDFDMLSTFLPEITENIQIPDMGTVIEFFISRSGNKNSNEKMVTSTTQKSQSNTGSAVEGILSQRPIDLHSHLKDGFESETDTEEFEKVGQSTNEKNQEDQKQKLPIQTTVSVSTSTSENKQPETVSASIETESIQTNTVETLTESNKCWTSSVQLISQSPPKKPPRLTKIINLANNHHPISKATPSVNTSITTTTTTTFPTLPVILEKDIQIITSSSPIKIPKKSINSIIVGHYSTAVPQKIDEIQIKTSPILSPNNTTTKTTTSTMIIDNEFINSEFYIDESLPSSLNDQDDYTTNFENNVTTLTTKTTTTTTRSSFGITDSEIRLSQIIDDCEKLPKKLTTNCKKSNICAGGSGINRNFYETDIDEEKIFNGATLNDCRGSLETVFGLLQENLGSRQLEIERLKLLLKNMSQVSYQCLELLKNNLESIKLDQKSNQNDIQLQLNKLSETWARVHNEYDSRERFSIEQIKDLHQQEINDLKLNLNKKENELELLKCELKTTESSHNENINLLQSQCIDFQKCIENLNKQISILEEKLTNYEIIKVKACNELRDKLMHEHKTEIESLRCRFKLMTSMERSPSDTSLEKIEKPDMIEIACHESILLQTREDFMNEKKEAIRDALESEKLKWESCMAAQSLSPASVKAMSANMELLNKMVEEKDKQLDAMRDRDLMLSKENCQLKMKIEALTNEEESDKGWLKEKIEYLNRDKNRLEHELGTEKNRRLEMETSIAAIKSSTIDSAMLRSKQGRPIITTDSCNSGDIVFVVWNIRHKQFIIEQETPSLYFVHGDSLNQLNLKLPIPGDSEIPVPFYTLARVVHKEYCQARKEENRYKVAKGTKFYRIKLDPLTEFKWHNRRERLESSSSTSGISVNRATTTTQQLIDSFAQTENEQAANTILLRTNKDTVDSPNSSSSSSITQFANYKERTVSVTSITEEEDEPIALISERNRYVSVSEEDERAVNDQPSSLSTDYENSITATISTSTTNILPSDDFDQKFSEILLNQQEIMDITNIAVSSLLDSNNQNDDSDEYRSLETKDDQEFPITIDATATTTSTTSSTIQTISPTPSNDI